MNLVGEHSVKWILPSWVSCFTGPLVNLHRSRDHKDVSVPGRRNHSRGGEAVAGWGAVVPTQLFIPLSDAVTTGCHLLAFVHSYFPSSWCCACSNSGSVDQLEDSWVPISSTSWCSAVRRLLFPRPSRKQGQFLSQNSHLQKALVLFLLLVGLLCGSSS